MIKVWKRNYFILKLIILADQSKYELFWYIELYLLMIFLL